MLFPSMLLSAFMSRRLSDSQSAWSSISRSCSKLRLLFSSMIRHSIVVTLSSGSMFSGSLRTKASAYREKLTKRDTSSEWMVSTRFFFTSIKRGKHWKSTFFTRTAGSRIPSSTSRSSKLVKYPFRSVGTMLSLKPKAVATSVPSFSTSLTVKLIQVNDEPWILGMNSSALSPYSLRGLDPGGRVTATAFFLGTSYPFPFPFVWTFISARYSSVPFPSIAAKRTPPFLFPTPYPSCHCYTCVRFGPSADPLHLPHVLGDQFRVMLLCGDKGVYGGQESMRIGII